MQGHISYFYLTSQILLTQSLKVNRHIYKYNHINLYCGSQ